MHSCARDVDSILELWMIIDGCHDGFVLVLVWLLTRVFQSCNFHVHIFSPTAKFSEGKKVGTRMYLSTKMCICKWMIWDSTLELSTISFVILGNRKKCFRLVFPHWIRLSGKKSWKWKCQAWKTHVRSHTRTNTKPSWQPSMIIHSSKILSTSRAHECIG